MEKGCDEAVKGISLTVGVANQPMTLLNVVDNGID
jgi:hypothetical protein